MNRRCPVNPMKNYPRTDAGIRPTRLSIARLHPINGAASCPAMRPLHDGVGNYLVGIDMFADEVEQKMVQLRHAGLISLSVSILLAVFFSIILSRNFTLRLSGW